MLDLSSGTSFTPDGKDDPYTRASVMIRGKQSEGEVSERLRVLPSTVLSPYFFVVLLLLLLLTKNSGSFRSD